MNNNEEYVLFFMHLGLATSWWAEIEFSLYNLGLACFSPKDASKLFYAYYAIENFSSKRQFISTLLKSHIKEETLLSDWDILEKDIKRLQTKRNQLAHWRRNHWEANDAGRRFVLMPRPEPNKDAGHKKDGKRIYPGDALGLVGVVNISKEFQNLNLQIMNFYRKLVGQPQQPAAFPGQPSDRTTIPILRRRIHEILGKPPKSLAR